MASKKNDDQEEPVLGTGAAGDPEKPFERDPADQGSTVPVDVPVPSDAPDQLGPDAQKKDEDDK